MQYEDSKKVAITFFIILLYFSAVFAYFYKFVKLSLLLGYAIGASASFLTFWIKESFSYLIIGKNKSQAASLSILSFIISLIFIASLTVILVFINKLSIKNMNNIYTKNSFKIAFYPINLISYIFGLTTLKMSLLLCFINKKGKEA
ncbi:Hypothetical protein, predicted transmembrane protein [Mycoplasmopsis agalactiae 14628]|uniref:Uncharacterized protein n=1 Tax=Mycoplasmopsis agalactiae 14628 TaxID=1110504 RepID=I5D518_MYCAA|nr:hypothetical protein [Mycoplasmopsis agalactiae]EIN14777.1 Hypothetical protein, predicted transmembrane protein [Mycoplasmopsis agalactiae 14628]